MQANFAVHNPRDTRTAGLVTRAFVVVGAALALGFALGHVTAPIAPAQHPVIRYVPVTVNSDQPTEAPSAYQLW